MSPALQLCVGQHKICTNSNREKNLSLSSVHPLLPRQRRVQVDKVVTQLWEQSLRDNEMFGSGKTGKRLQRLLELHSIQFPKLIVLPGEATELRAGYLFNK